MLASTCKNALRPPTVSCNRYISSLSLLRSSACRLQQSPKSLTLTLAQRQLFQSPGPSVSRSSHSRSDGKAPYHWKDWFSTSRIRAFHSSTVVQHGGIVRPEPGQGITIHFKDSKGALLKTVEANEGDDILSIAHEHDIDLEGACEGSVACSTCHVILPTEYYDKLPEPEDDENDMLDMAFGLTDTSRLGCQVKLTKELDGITATLPSATRNMFVDGKKSSH